MKVLHFLGIRYLYTQAFLYLIYIVNFLKMKYLYFIFLPLYRVWLISLSQYEVYINFPQINYKTTNGVIWPCICGAEHRVMIHVVQTMYPILLKRAVYRNWNMKDIHPNSQKAFHTGLPFLSSRDVPLEMHAWLSETILLRWKISC